jgi:hypothetical protein
MIKAHRTLHPSPSVTSRRESFVRVIEAYVVRGPGMAAIQL